MHFYFEERPKTLSHDHKLAISALESKDHMNTYTHKKKPHQLIFSPSPFDMHFKGEIIPMSSPQNEQNFCSISQTLSLSQIRRDWGIRGKFHINDDDDKEGQT